MNPEKPRETSQGGKVLHFRHPRHTLVDIEILTDQNRKRLAELQQDKGELESLQTKREITTKAISKLNKDIGQILTTIETTKEIIAKHGNLINTKTNDINLMEGLANTSDAIANARAAIESAQRTIKSANKHLTELDYDLERNHITLQDALEELRGINEEIKKLESQSSTG